MTNRYTLNEHVVVLSPAQSAIPLPVTPDLYAQLDQEFQQFKQHQLISQFAFDRDWPSWEMHPWCCWCRAAALCCVTAAAASSPIHCYTRATFLLCRAPLGTPLQLTPIAA